MQSKPSAPAWLRLTVAIEAATHIVTEATYSFRRNGLMTAAAVTTVTVALVTVGAAVLAGLNLAHLAAALEAQVQVVAFLRDGTAAAEAVALRQAIAQIPGVAAVRFVSRAEALERLRRRLGSVASFADLGGGNPLPDSLEVHVANAGAIPAVAGAIRRHHGVDEVSYGAQVTDRLVALTRVMRLIAAVLTVFLAGVALIVVVNTIRLTVIARAQEIEIMTLVGATRWFVRWPFLIEGMLEGLLAALAGTALLAGAYALMASRLQASLPFVPVLPASQMLGPLTAALLPAGVAVGTAGSAVAVRRFLAQ